MSVFCIFENHGDLQGGVRTFSVGLLIFNLLEHVLGYSNYRLQTKHRLARIKHWFTSASDCYKKREFTN